MSPIKTAIWTILHLPYHIAIVLTVEGSGQWITWRRTWEAMNEAISSFTDGFLQGVSSGKGGQGVYDTVLETLQKSYDTYTFSTKAVVTMGEELEKIPTFPDSYWNSFDVDRFMSNPTANDTAVKKIFATVQGALVNSVFSTYGLTTSSKAKAQAEAASETDKLNGEDLATEAVLDRLVMIVSSDPIPSSPALVPILDQPQHPCQN